MITSKTEQKLSSVGANCLCSTLRNRLFFFFFAKQLKNNALDILGSNFLKGVTQLNLYQGSWIIGRDLTEFLGWGEIID